MWGKPKPTAAEETTFGWRDHNLKMLLSTLQADRPLLQTVITGFRQGIKIDGLEYRSKINRARSDQELYDKAALLFEGVPEGEETASMFATENEFAGTFHFGQARMKGGFSVTSDLEELKTSGRIGHAYIEGYGIPSEGPLTPLLEVHFTLADQKAEDHVQSALLTALATGTAHCNFSVDRIEDAEAWMQDFRSNGYSQSLTVRRVFIGTEAGKGFIN